MDDDISLGSDDTINTVCQAQVSRRNFSHGRHFLGTLGNVAGHVGDGIPLPSCLQAIQCYVETEYLERVLNQVYRLPKITPNNKTPEEVVSSILLSKVFRCVVDNHRILRDFFHQTKMDILFTIARKCIDWQSLTLKRINKCFKRWFVKLQQESRGTSIV